jgi:hypothetical protein
MGTISNDEMKLGSLEVEHFLPKIARKSGILFRDNRMRHEMNLEDIIHENLSHCGGCEWVLKST